MQIFSNHAMMQPSLAIRICGMGSVRTKSNTAAGKRKALSIYLSDDNYRRFARIHASMKVKIPLTALGEFAIVRFIEKFESNPEQLLLDLSK